ncbi:hypothetical protein ABEW24_22950 [Paenibacillus jamilae]|uniref:hypothetical protein n=1 Tax=Paenibacillus TaxID=44249 RepID=UPI0018C86200|nr:hypothetical protein [Paenibacillus polymyxa]
MLLPLDSCDCISPDIGWNPEAKASADASPERFRPLRCTQHQPSCGSRTREGAAHKMPHLPKGDGKACSTAFYRRPRSREGCRICAANSPLPSRERAGSRSEALSHRIRAQRSTCAQQGEARMLAARHAVLRPQAEWYCGDMRVKTLFCTNVKALLDESLCEQAFIQRNALTSL